MGCDIKTALLRRGKDNEFAVVYDYSDELFPDRSYGLFGFLAGVRNYSQVPPISDRRPLSPELHRHVYPQQIKIGFGGFEYEDDSDIGGILGHTEELHSVTWIGVDELLSFDYSQKFEDRRDSCGTVAIGSGQMTTYREFLYEKYFTILEGFRKHGDPKDLVLVVGFLG